MTDTLIADGQVLLTRGDGTTLLMGPDKPNAYRINKSNFLGLVDQVNAAQPSLQDGEVPGLMRDGGRTMDMELQLTADFVTQRAQCVADRETLEAFWATGNDFPGTATLAWQDGGVKRFRYGSPQGIDIQDNVLWFKRIKPTFRAWDPRSYALTEDEFTGDTVLVTNYGLRASIDWRLTVPGPFTGGRLAFYTVAVGTGIATLHTYNFPDVGSGNTLEVVARRDEIRIVRNSDSVILTTVGGLTLDDDGSFAELVSIPPGIGTYFQWTADTGTDTVTAHVRACYP